MKQFLASLFPDWINDKGKHAILGTLIYLGILAFFNSLIALVFVVIIAALVEIYDYTSKKGTPEVLDFVYTIAVPIILYLLWQI